MADATQIVEPKKTLPVVIFADFVCPYSYIAQEQVDLLMKEYDVQPIWRPHWLHPEIPPEGKPTAVDPERRKTTMTWLKEMAPEMAERINPPQKQQFTFFAHEAMEFAHDRGKANLLRTAIFDALWVEGKDIGQVSTLQECAEKVGLDGEELGKDLYERKYTERTLEAILGARKMGIHQTPTTILGRTAIIGWHYYEVYQSVMEKQNVIPRAKLAEAKG